MATETQHQVAVINWSQQPHIRQKWPELALLYHIKNETKEGARQVAVDKSMGVKKGVPDLHLPVARGAYHSLYIEMKTPNGRPSSEQLWWRDRLEEQGNAWCICYGWKEAVSVLENYMGMGDYSGGEICIPLGTPSAE